MILYINTTKGDNIEVILRDGERQIIKKKVSARFQQAEKLLPLVDKILKQKKIKLKDIKKIKVENRGGGFTALRIGVVTANALGYALGAKVMPNAEYRMPNLKKKSIDIITPVYDKEPNITVKKR